MHEAPVFKPTKFASIIFLHVEHPQREAIEAKLLEQALDWAKNVGATGVLVNTKQIGESTRELFYRNSFEARLTSFTRSIQSSRLATRLLPEQVQVRPVNLCDQIAIKLLVHDIQSLHHSLMPEVFSEATFDGKFDAICARYVVPEEESETLVVECLGRVCGFVTVKSKPPSFEEPSTSGFIEALVVDKGYRKLGLGSTLMAHAEAWALAQKAATMHLCVWSPNNDANIFYREIGYLPQYSELCKRI